MKIFLQYLLVSAILFFQAEIAFSQRENIKTDTVFSTNKNEIKTRIYYYNENHFLDSLVILNNINEPAKIVYYFENNSLHIDSFSGTYKEFYSNGKLAANYIFENGKPIGKANLFHENGNLKVEKNYNKTGLHGLFKSYYENGKLHEERFCWNGYLDSFGKVYWPNGKIKKEAEIVLNRINGFFKAYDTSGNLIREEFYRFGHADGVLKAWNSDGKLEKQTTIIAGNPHRHEVVFYDNLNIKFEFNRLTCLSSWYYRNGQKAKESSCMNGSKIFYTSEGKKTNETAFLKLIDFNNIETLKPVGAAANIFDEKWTDASLFKDWEAEFDTLLQMPKYKNGTEDVINYLKFQPEIQELMDSVDVGFIDLTLWFSPLTPTIYIDLPNYPDQDFKKNEFGRFYKAINAMDGWQLGIHRGIALKTKIHIRFPMK